MNDEKTVEEIEEAVAKHREEIDSIEFLNPSSFDNLSEETVDEQIHNIVAFRAERRKKEEDEAGNLSAETEKMTMVEVDDDKLKPINRIPITDNKFVAPDGWSLSEFGIKYVGPNENLQKAIMHTPLWVSKRYKGIDIAGMPYEMYELTYLKDGIAHQINADPLTIQSHYQITKLAKHGIWVNSANAKAYMSFLTEFMSANREQIELVDVETHTGWREYNEEEVFIPYHDGISVMRGSVSETMRKQLSAKKGTLDQWVNTIGKTRERPVIRSMMAAGLSTLLLKPLGEANFCVLMTGRSGTGKTAAAKTVMSMFGNPELVATANTTQNGAEYLASFFLDYPIVFDEALQGRSPKKVGELIMDIANGTGRIRMTKDRQLDKIASYRTVAFFTSEDIPIEECANEGQRNRVIQLKDKPFGTFKGDEDGNEAMELTHLYDDLAKCYGHVARVISEFIYPHLSSIRFIQLQISTKLDQNASRHKKAATLIGVSDYLLSTVIYGLDEEQALKEAIETAKYVISKQEEIKKEEGDKSERAFNYLVDNIAMLKWNKEEDRYENGPKVVGYRQYEKVYLNVTYVNEILKDAGFDARRLVEDCPQIKKLNSPKKFGGTSMRVYEIDLEDKKEEVSDDENKKIEETTEDVEADSEERKAEEDRECDDIREEDIPDIPFFADLETINEAKQVDDMDWLTKN